MTDPRPRIEEMSHLNAFITVAEEVGEGPMVAVKDLIDVRGMPTTGGGAILPMIPATRDAEVISRIRKRGCTIVGKTNLHEWAFGVSGANPHHGIVRNPRDPDRLAGGSSSGSAAAVAARMCDWAIGTETGGSIRIPSALCGIVGLKPTVGRVSTDGVIPLSPSLDVVGPMAPDLETAARALEWMTGLEDLVPSLPGRISDFRIGVPAGWVEDLDHSTEEVWGQVRAPFPDIAFPPRPRVVAPLTTIMYAEAASYHQRWLKTCPELYGTDVRERLEMGLTIPAVDYLAAIEEQGRIREEVSVALCGWDAILLPVTACVAPRLDQTTVYEQLVRFTRPFGLTGHPAITLPAPSAGLPVGVQLVGGWGQEKQLIRAAQALMSSWAHREGDQGRAGHSGPQ